MRVAILTETFAKSMGYAGSMLPKYLAKLGVDVHVVTTGLHPYHSIGGFDNIYGGFSKSQYLVPGSIEKHDGYTIHALKHVRCFGYVRMLGLARELDSIKPHIVQTFSAIGPIPMEAALLRTNRAYKLFTGSHTTASVFPLSKGNLPACHPRRLACFALRTMPGRMVSGFTEKCYGATIDCGEVAVRYFGVPRSKMDVCPLGVDTEIFYPANKPKNKERTAIRLKLGFSEKEIVCIYTGRFTEDKNPALLAQAVDLLCREGRTYRGLFLGAGPQEDRLRSYPTSKVMRYLPVQELGGYFRCSDIGVWPTQESTSMLDAAACGLPIVVNHTLKAVERVEGNGLRYRLNDLNELVSALHRLQDVSLRRELGRFGAEKMKREFSWESIAKRRLDDYQAATGTMTRVQGDIR